MIHLRFQRPAPADPYADWVPRNVRLPAGSVHEGPMVPEPWQLQLGADFEIWPGTFVLKCASGVGKTIWEISAILWIRGNFDGDILLVYPTEGLWDRDRITKWQPVLDASPAIKTEFNLPRSGDLPGGRPLEHRRGNIIIGYSTARLTMQGTHLRFAGTDELDEFLAHGDEDPVDNIWQRTTNFRGQERVLFPSTPKADKNRSLIERVYQRGDRREFFVTCPDCGHEYFFTWEQMRDGRMYCLECAVEVTERKRLELIEAARFMPTNDEGEEGLYSYHVPQMASRFSSLATSWQSYCRYTPAMFAQNVLAEPYTHSEAAAGMEPSALLVLMTPHRRSRPECVTVGVDVGRRELWYQVLAWWDGETYHETWETSYVSRSPSAATDLKPFRELRGRLRKYRPDLTLMDAGYHQDIVCDAIRQVWGTDLTNKRIFPVRGDTREPDKIPYDTMVDPNGQRMSHGITGLRINTQMVKDHISDTLQDAVAQADGDPPCRFVEPDVPADYIDHITAEHKVNTGDYWMWVVKSAGAFNHHLDTRVYAVAARRHVGNDVRRLSIPSTTNVF